MGSCMTCLAVVTNSRKINTGGGGFWQVWREEICMQGLVVKPEGIRPFE